MGARFALERQRDMQHITAIVEKVRKQTRAFLRRPLVWRARRRERLASGSLKYELAICAIFREEAPFLAEWIEFHHGIGVTQFYLYNNFSTDDFTEVLAPYIQSGLVTLLDWPVPVGQISAYRHCIKARWRDARWIAFIDIDEYLFSPLQTSILSILQNHHNFPGLHVWQLFFGSSGHETRPKGPLVESFTRRAPLSQTTVKSIVNPRLVYKVGVHTSKFWEDESRDTHGRLIAPSLLPVLDILRINHYWSRSLSDLDQKVRRGDASTAMARNRDWHFNFEKELNMEHDESIMPIARAIRMSNRT